MTTEFLAKPSSSCCLKGSIHDGDAQGTVATVAGVETYVSRPAEGKANGNIVFYFADIHGLSINARLLMDTVACAGYLVLGLDYFHGVSLSF
jgi:dienelactone hydrolase